jgi:hypothetical protein
MARNSPRTRKSLNPCLDDWDIYVLAEPSASIIRYSTKGIAEQCVIMLILYPN